MPEWLGKAIGQVRVEKLLARGGMAEVYLGTHVNLDRPVAVKVLHSYIEQEPVLLERFHREARVVAGLRHPNIVRVFDFDTVDNHPYIVMEYLGGPTLENYLKQLHQRKKRLPFEQVARLLEGIAVALDYAHSQGVIHRDIKPSNVLLNSGTDEIVAGRPLPEDAQAILTDFGLVRFVDSATQTVSGFFSATPTYAAPEQARGDPTDHRTDIYSLGVVLYEMLAGRVPFQADNAVAMLHMHIHMLPPPIPEIPSEAQDVVERALEKKPEDRFQSSGEMANAFRAAIGLTPRRGENSKPARQSALHGEGSILPSASAPATPEPLPTRQRVSPAVPSPTMQSEPSARPAPRETAQRNPVPSWIWVGLGFFILVAISLLGLGAIRSLPARGGAPAASQAAGAGETDAAASIAPPATSLPSATNMVEVQAGTYELGTDLITDEFHVAKREVQLNGFWIDQYQTTNDEYQQFMAATGAAKPMIWPGEGKHPVSGVTWDQADAYCHWANKRLPDEAEWEASGRGAGPSPRLYPWGNDATAGGNALNLPSQDTYEVGSQPFNVSLLNVYDMVGNVWEWVGEPYASVPAGDRVLRGGRYGNPQDLAYRLVVAEDARIILYAGFRCAAPRVAGQ